MTGKMSLRYTAIDSNNHFDGGDMARNPSEVRQLIRRGNFLRPTAGLAPGYAKIAMVITADFMKLAQAKPGDKVRFQSIGVEEAAGPLKELEKTLDKIKNLFREG